MLIAAGAARAREIVVLGADDAYNVDVVVAARSLAPAGDVAAADTDGERPRPATPRAPLCVVEVRRPSIASALAAHEISAPAAVRVEYVDPWCGQLASCSRSSSSVPDRRWS